MAEFKKTTFDTFFLQTALRRFNKSENEKKKHIENDAGTVFFGAIFVRKKILVFQRIILRNSLKNGQNLCIFAYGIV